MRARAVFAAALSLLAVAPRSLASKIVPRSTYKPPQVFKNAQLLHVISLEKNYVKANINVLVENVGKEAQDEYFLPFASEQISKLGGVEVKDAGSGPFVLEAVDIDPLSDLQYYRIRLPSPLQPGAQLTLGISYYVLRAYNPLPASIAQDEPQFLTYAFSAYAPSAYPTATQKTEVQFGTSNIPGYTKIGDFPKKQGAKLTYGPFGEKPAGAHEPVTVHFEFTKPVTHVVELERDVEVSHWGGNIAFEEHYTLLNRGANLSSQFNRVKWQQSQSYQPAIHALREMRFPLRVGSVDPYYTDTIGNVSTSHFRSNKRNALLEAKPRYPVFGGWKYPFTIGWNSDAKNFLKTANGGYMLKVPFLEGLKQPEGVEYGKIRVRVILPEGAANVKYFAAIPRSSIAEAGIEIHKTYLDTIGRTAILIKAHNLVDAFQNRDLIVTYDHPLFAALLKPIIIFGSLMAVFVSTWVLGNVELKFSSNT